MKKHIIWTEKDEVMGWRTFCENKTDYAACLKSAV